ncbi:hypothetical protein ACM46_02095 [Chryseobacterium angstadtii]|uniref:Lipoprotein n=1 Tax=Chryseobacterium angstadtii TaxID=558151 RepID=A0A0J7IJZ9_9FLAO|nr:hypothetical protein [Chryseobacterium angstadtii]KMQ66356.1 hypothetical protein ACM46_02095 [Chryseobacterium angstadtii]
MKNTILGVIAVSIISVSCNKDEKPTYLKEEAGVQQPNIAVNSAPKASLMDQAGFSSKPNLTPVSSPSGVLNPPHGQPGHRCDIPVGQPLTGSPAPAQAAPGQNITVNPSNAVKIDPNSMSPGKVAIDNNGKQVKTAPGMNPPHGQPGHRCDIPVGQPLSSKPAPAPAPQPVQNAAQNVPGPVTAAPPTGEKPKLNPAHGEPWHNCALKVGDPLS